MRTGKRLPILRSFCKMGYQIAIRIGLHAVFGAPESTLIQRFYGLSNTKFAQNRIES
jgi:hypothetical protein